MLTIIPNTHTNLSLISAIPDKDSYFLNECPIVAWAVQPEVFPSDGGPPNFESVKPIVFQEASNQWFVYDRLTDQAWDRHGTVCTSRKDVDYFFESLHNGYPEQPEDEED